MSERTPEQIADAVPDTERTPEQIAAKIASDMTGCDMSHGTPAGDLAASMDTDALSGRDVLDALTAAARAGIHAGCRAAHAGPKPEPGSPYSGPEARVEEYLIAGDFDMGSDLIDEAPGGASLNASDLRDVLRELRTWRAYAREMTQQVAALTANEPDPTPQGDPITTEDD